MKCKTPDNYRPHHWIIWHFCKSLTCQWRLINRTDRYIVGIFFSAVCAFLHSEISNKHLTKKAEPPPTRGVNRDSGTASANGGWLRRLVRQHVNRPHKYHLQSCDTSNTSKECRNANCLAEYNSSLPAHTRHQDQVTADHARRCCVFQKQKSEQRHRYESRNSTKSRADNTDAGGSQHAVVATPQ